MHKGHSLRATQTVFRALGRTPPSRDARVDFLDRAGRAAGRLLLRAREQLHGRLECLAGDDICFLRTPIKVLIEPGNGALLHVLRWPWHTAEDWALMLSLWTVNGHQDLTHFGHQKLTHPGSVSMAAHRVSVATS